MPDTAHVIAGRYTTVFEGTREQRGSATEKRTGLAVSRNNTAICPFSSSLTALDNY